MSEYTRTVFESLEQGRAGFTQTYTALRTEVSGLDAELRSSLPTWDDHAQQAYYTAKARWDAAMASMDVVLARLGSVIGAASTGYQAAEAASTALWS